MWLKVANSTSSLTSRRSAYTRPISAGFNSADVQIQDRKSPGSDRPDSACPEAGRETYTRRRLLGNLAIGPVLLPCGCPRRASASSETWDYGTTNGPLTWGGTCSSGTRQSPINLPMSDSLTQRGRVSVIQEYSRAADITVINTGHGNLQVNVSNGGSCTIQGREYKLLQWHFHAPSEHAFGGNRDAMELHIVHKEVNTGDLAVIGVLLRKEAEEPLRALDLAIKNSPANVQGHDTHQIDLYSVLQEALLHAGHFEHYVGSLTTPPCTEGVQWYIAVNPVRVTNQQVLDFEGLISANHVFRTNARPMQSIVPGCIEVDLV